jgi:hypothetical protein
VMHQRALNLVDVLVNRCVFLMTLLPHRAPALCLLALVLGATPARSFDVQHSKARYADKQYHYELTVTLDAPVERVEAVLRDYARYPMLDPRILEARVLEHSASNGVTLETTVRACFGPFCRNVKRIEHVQEAPHSLTAITDPSRSDVKFGETRTQLSASGGGRTRVSYHTSITPGFWIPSIVGRRWMLRTLEDASTNLFMNVEMQAKK